MARNRPARPSGHGVWPLVSALLTACGAAVALVAAAPESVVVPFDLRVDGLLGQTFAGSRAPLLSYKLRLADGLAPSTLAAQSASRIVAGTSPAEVLAGSYACWDSGWVSGNATVDIPFGGAGALAQPGDSCFWTVFVRDTAGGETSAPPPPVALTLAPLSPADWAGAEWITANATMQGSDCECYDEASNPVPVMRTAFSTRATPANPVVSASLFVAGVGFFEAYVSGSRVGSARPLADPGTAFGSPAGSAGASVGDDVLSPPWSNFSATTYFSAYNVTSLLLPNSTAQVLGLVLGRGWFDPYPMRLFGAFDVRSVVPVGRPQALVLLVVLYADGTRQTVVSSSSAAGAWVWAPGPLLRNNVYIGEVYDARLAPALAGWTLPSYNATTASWRPVLASPRTNVRGLRLLSSSQVRITESLAPASLTPVPGIPTSYVLSFPANIAGWLSVTGVRSSRPGLALNFTFAEIIDQATGLPDPITNLAGSIGRWNGSDWGACAPVPAVEVDTWILAGDGSSESFTPKFTWHAFQHVRIDGWDAAALGGAPTQALFSALAVNADAGPAGSFVSYNPQHAAIEALASRSFRSNWAGGHQSDCPGRERLGYGGDLLAAAEAALLLFDAGPLYAKRVRDYGDAQTSAGGFPETAPFIGIETCDTFGDGTGPMQWGAAHSELQRELLPYAQGVGALVAEQYPRSLAWANHLNASATGEGILSNGLCDFTFSNKTECACNGTGSVAPLMGTAFFAGQADNLALLAAELGREDDAAAWRARAAQVRAAFVASFVNASTGEVGLKDASGQVQRMSALDPLFWALGLDLLRDAGAGVEDAVANLARARLLANGSHAFLGAFATGYLYRRAQDFGSDPRGLVDAAYASLALTTFPSYGFMLANGATSLWEHWAALWEQDSWNHAWLGSVGAFFRRVVGGIAPEPTARAADKVRVRPYPPLLGSAAARPQQPGQEPASLGGSAGGGGPVWANTTFASARGDVTSAWVLSPGGSAPGAVATLTLAVTAPANVVVTVELPLAAPVAGKEAGGAAPATTACAWAGSGTVDPAAGVVRWVLVGYTACGFSAEWT